VVAVLEHADRVAGRRARLRIDGYAAGFEPSLASARPRGDGIAAVLRRALTASGRRPEEIAAVIASAHGTPVDAAERDAIRSVLGAPRLLTPKAALGETFAAAGLLGLALAAGEPGAVLVNDVCYSGALTSVVLSPG
jgi:3-oxoacyl-[acyl-carrier-protein] synthase II